MDPKKITVDGTHRLIAQLDAGGLHEEILFDILDEVGCSCEDHSIPEMVFALVDFIGLERSVRVFQDNEFSVSLGPYVVVNNRTGEYYSLDFGWLPEKEAATGFRASDVVSETVNFVLTDFQWYWCKKKDEKHLKHGPFSDKELAAAAAINCIGFPAPIFVCNGLFVSFDIEYANDLGIAA